MIVAPTMIHNYGVLGEVMLKGTHHPTTSLSLSKLYIESIPLIMEYLVKISKKERILELKRRNMKKTDSDIQYAVSIKEDTVYPCLHFTRNHEELNSYTPYPGESICRILNQAYDDSGRYQTWSLLQESPVRLIPHRLITAY
ncbi:hypothetical protein Tco_0886817 [Tanacetum coccineum]